MTWSNKIFLALALALTLATACAPSGARRWESEVNRAFGRGFRPLSLATPPFHLAALLKGQTHEELVVYLEGDGRAIVHGRPASDPSPRYAQSLELALLDPAPAVLYLARIGQFQPLDAIKANEIYWTDKRLSEEAVNAAGEAIDQAKRLVKASKIHLIGYSGGGGLAALLAERRFDVASLVTVAGLLDTDYWVLNHGWRPLIGSLNPIKNAKNTAFIPQIHFYGSKDYIIDSSLSLRFEQASQFANFKRLSQDADHYSGWTPKWPSLLTQYVVPLRRPSFSPPATIDLGSSLSLRP